MLGTPLVFAQSVKTPAAAPAQAKGKTSVEQKAVDKKAEPKYNVEDFTFNLEAGRNPFEPVVLLKAKTSRGSFVSTSKTKKKEAAAKVSYELEELRLVGVIKSEKGMIAMMEDTQGKGVFFRKGDHLNDSMWVMDISGSSVVLGHKLKGDTKKIVIDIPTKN